jgi:hypothetical protein
MISDLTVYWSLFCELYEILKEEAGSDADLPILIDRLLAADPALGGQLFRIVEGRSSHEQDGQFWRSHQHQLRTLQRVPLADLSPSNPSGRHNLAAVWRTLRNGYAHFNWHYGNQSDSAYWQTMGWDLTNAQPDFQMGSHPEGGYLAYIADAAPPWNSRDFWNMRNLRIIVTPYITLRYHLHLFLNIFLNGQSLSIFGVLEP